ncbi:MAG: hypothetical protein ACREAE_06775 [Nitrosopumilaceae archaeon]
MALKAAIVITSISIALLIIYGADAAIGGGTGQGFLPFDHKVRGVALGIPSVALPIIAYVTTRKDTSKLLGILIIASGLLTLIGSVAFLAMQDSNTTGMAKDRSSEFAPIIAIGALIVGLGIMKIKKSSKLVLK